MQPFLFKRKLVSVSCPACFTKDSEATCHILWSGDQLSPLTSLKVWIIKTLTHQAPAIWGFPHVGLWVESENDIERFGAVTASRCVACLGSGCWLICYFLFSKTYSVCKLANTKDGWGGSLFDFSGITSSAIIFLVQIQRLGIHLGQLQMDLCYLFSDASFCHLWFVYVCKKLVGVYPSQCSAQAWWESKRCPKTGLYNLSYFSCPWKARVFEAYFPASFPRPPSCLPTIHIWL